MRLLLSATALALLLAVTTVTAAVAKPKASADQDPAARPVPLLVALSAANGSLGTGADGTTTFTLSGLDDVALRVSGGEAIPMTLPAFSSTFGPLFGGESANALVSVGSADPAAAPAKIALNLGTPVFDQDALVMTFPVSVPAWSTTHPAALPWAEPDLAVDGPLDLGPVSLVMSGTSARSAIVGPLEILVVPAADGRSVGVVVLGEGAALVSSRATPEAPYLAFYGMLSDGSTAEGEMEVGFTRDGGRLTAKNIKVAGPQPAAFGGLLATW
jgi:hypothetical protein